MSQPPEVELLREAGKLAKRELMDIAQAMYGVVMGTDGETFGDSQMTRSDRILRWVVAAQDGTLDILRVQSPKVYADGLKQYQKDIAAELEAASAVPQPDVMTPFGGA